MDRYLERPMSPDEPRPGPRWSAQTFVGAPANLFDARRLGLGASVLVRYLDESLGRMLGISARTLYRKLSEYEIDERAKEVA